MLLYRLAHVSRALSISKKHKESPNGLGSQSSVAHVPPAKVFFYYSVDKESPDTQNIGELHLDLLETERYKNFILILPCFAATFLSSYFMDPAELAVLDTASSRSISATITDHPDFESFTISKALARALQFL